MQVQINIRTQSRQFVEMFGRNCNVVLNVEEHSRVGDLSRELSKRFRIPEKRFFFVLCGKKLHMQAIVEELLLGPQTALTAVVVEPSDSICEQYEPKIKHRRYAEPFGIRSYHVFCKNCDGPRRGKLRVYCGDCGSDSVILSGEPTSWKDVFASNTIGVDCKECGKKAQADFWFKCVECGKISTPLIHIRGANGPNSCVVCCNTAEVVVELDCHHQTCLHCFTIYLKSAFNEQQYTILPPDGYTVTCPVYGCRARITDPHTFYLMGKDMYGMYQRQATERFVYLERDGIFCPFEACGAAFFWKADAAGDLKAVCPECHHSFCMHCKYENCVCSENNATAATIAATCHKCPSCGTPTERSGGCAHMHCIQCDAHWCFICNNVWSENCQWDHWFD